MMILRMKKWKVNSRIMKTFKRNNLILKRKNLMLRKTPYLGKGILVITGYEEGIENYHISL